MGKTAAKILLDTLVMHGIDRAFCVPGESYLAVMSELHDDPVLHLVTCRHEGGAAFMALADAKLTGRVGVVFASRGPGATNASIAAHSAEQGAQPLLLLLGQVGTRKLGRHATQEMDFTKTFGDIAKCVEEVHDPDRIAEIVARAIRIAESGTPGPVVVGLPTDVLEAETEAKPLGPPGGDPCPAVGFRRGRGRRHAGRGGAAHRHRRRAGAPAGRAPGAARRRGGLVAAGLRHLRASGRVRPRAPEFRGRARHPPAQAVAGRRHGRRRHPRRRHAARRHGHPQRQPARARTSG